MVNEYDVMVDIHDLAMEMMYYEDIEYYEAITRANRIQQEVLCGN